MARLLGPDESTRFALRYTKSHQIEGMPGKNLKVFTDEACENPASIALYDPSAPDTPGDEIRNQTVRVGQDSMLPLFWFPDDVETLWAQTRDGYVLRLTAAPEMHLDEAKGGPFLRSALNLTDLSNPALSRMNLGLAGAAELEVGTTAGTVAAGDDPRIVHSLQILNATEAPYNATGDGVTNDTSAIQAAMTAAAAAGKVCYLPPGLYRVGRLEVPHGLIMQGAHPGGYGVSLTDQNQTRLGLIAGTNDHMLHGAAGVAHVRLSHLHFDGNKNNNTSGNIIHLDDVNPGEEVQWHIRDCFIDAAAGYGIYVGARRRAVQISDCTINYSRLSGIWIVGSDSHIQRCILGTNGENGIVAGGAVTRIYDCDIYGNGTAGNSGTGNGIVVSSTLTQVFIHGCGIDRNLRNGVLLNASVNMVSIEQSTFHSNSQDVNAAAHHINVKTTTGGVSVSGCTFQTDGLSNSPGYGIYLDTGATAHAAGNSFVSTAFQTGNFCNDMGRLYGGAAYGTFAGRQGATDINEGSMFVASDAGAYVSANASWARFTAVPRVEKWFPNGAITCNVDRATSQMGSNTGLIVSGRLQLAGGLVIPAGVTVSNISFLTGTTAPAGLTNQWFCLVGVDGTVLAKTADAGSAGWSGNAVKTLALTSPYTPTVDKPVYAGLVLVGTTMPDIRGPNASSVPFGIAPIIAGQANTGLTNPASLGSSIGTLTAASAIPFAYLS